MENDKIDELVAEINALFQIDTIRQDYGNNFNGDIVWDRHDFHIPPRNNSFKNSSYYCEKVRLVHFTSLSALNSIINEKSIRLFNLYNLNDPREFEFASKMFELEQNRIDDAKQNIFIASFCDESILEKISTEFNMWRLYGDQGKGVAIIFSIQNTVSDWNDFHISSVHYGTKKRKPLKRIANKIVNLNKTKPSLHVDLSKICVFHKSNLFKLEKEIRIIYDNRHMRNGFSNRTISNQGQILFPTIKHDLQKLKENNIDVKYLQLPIFSEDMPMNIGDNVLSSLYIENPILKIDKIVIGYNYKQTEQIENIINEVSSKYLGYKPQIEQTRLSKFYWGY